MRDVGDASSCTRVLGRYADDASRGERASAPTCPAPMSIIGNAIPVRYGVPAERYPSYAIPTAETASEAASSVALPNQAVSWVRTSRRRVDERDR